MSSRTCSTCYFSVVAPNKEPCKDCDRGQWWEPCNSMYDYADLGALEASNQCLATYGKVRQALTVKENISNPQCLGCKHLDNRCNQPPCVDCGDGKNWEARVSKEEALSLLFELKYRVEDIYFALRQAGIIDY